MTKQELIEKVTAYVARTYGDGTQVGFLKAFDANDEDKDGRISRVELTGILAKSGVADHIGGRIERLAIAQEILDTLDADGDGYIEWLEFVALFDQKR